MKWGACYFLEMEFLTFSFFRSPFKNAYTFFFGEHTFINFWPSQNQKPQKPFYQAELNLALKPNKNAMQ